MHAITMGLLGAGHSVKVLSIATGKHPFDRSAMPAEYLERTGIEGIFTDTRLNVVDAFTDLVTSDNYNISRFFSPDMDIRLIRLLSAEAFDVVLLESLFVTPYIATIRRYSKAPIVLRSHNLEHMIQERIAHGERNPLKRPYRRFLARQLERYEMEVLDRVDGVAAITPADAAHFTAHGRKAPIITIPYGVEPEASPCDMPPGPPVFFHLGSMDWLPNEEGVRWLIEAVWPLVLKEHPEARLHLAGNKMPADLLALRIQGLTVEGRVPDADAFVAGRHVLVVPLFSAGGMRVKIIEAMAMGKCVISTPLGAEGIEHTDGHDILLARDAAEMAACMGTVLTRPGRCAEVGRHARELVERRYSTARITGELVAFMQSLLPR